MSPRDLLEVDLVDVLDAITEVAPEPQTARSAPGSPAQALAHSSRVPSSTARLPSMESEPALGPSAAPTAQETSGRPNAEHRPKKNVRLFLSARELKKITDSSFLEAEPASEPSVGLLREGLEALDAEKGLSPSSPQVSAGYRAAAFGPEVGTAVFEVRADAGGVVTSVRVVGGQGDGA